jgi:hypothetical protein
MEREKEEFKDFFRGDMLKRVLYHKDFEIEIKDGDIIISDEADYLMFNNPEGFFNIAGSYPMISMTASVPLTDTKSLEQDVMDEMKMTTFSYSKIETVEKFDFDEVLSNMTNEKFVDRLT